MRFADNLRRAPAPPQGSPQVDDASPQINGHAIVERESRQHLKQTATASPQAAVAQRIATAAPARFYVRLWQSEIALFDAHLEPLDAWLFVRLLALYVQKTAAGTRLLDSNVELARALRLKPATWLKLRARLLELGFLETADGALTVVDQDRSVAMQIGAKHRSAAAHAAKAAKRGADLG